MQSVSDDQNYSAVIAEITSAFANVSLDNGVTLHEARAKDDWATVEHQRAVRANDTELHWRDVTDDKLCYFSDVLTFLDDKGWVFYIPAFMRWTIRHLDTGDEHDGLNYSTFYSIAYDERRPPLLDAEQTRAVCSFLRYVSRRQYLKTEAEDAFKKWETYAGGSAE